MVGTKIDTDTDIGMGIGIGIGTGIGIGIDTDIDILPASFSYSRSVENIVYFLLREGLDIGKHYLCSRIQHALLEIILLEQNMFVEGP